MMSKFHHQPTWVFSVCLLLSFVQPASGDFEISVNSGNLSPGGTLLLDIGIDSDTPPEDMSSYDLVLEITPLQATAGTSLIFVDPQSEAFLESADYVFADTSDVIAQDDTAVVENTGSKIVFVDLSVDGNGLETDVEVTSGQLLASIDLGHVLGGVAPADTVGDQFEIVVGLASLFLQESGDEVEFSSTRGLVTITATAIPEPGSLVLLFAGTCGLLVRRRRR